MAPEQQADRDRDVYRLVIFSQDRRSVLVLCERQRLVLPSAGIPRWQRVAEYLTATLKSKYGCEAIALFGPETTVPASDSGGRRYHVLECRCNGKTHPDNAVWMPIDSLTRDCFQSEADHEAFQSGVAQADFHQADPKSPFGQRGWFCELSFWVAETIQPLGLRLTGTYRQCNASPSFSLIRFATNGPAIWFKGVGEPNEREFPVTLRIVRSFPRYVPEVIGTYPAWHAWLSLEAQGTNLSQTDKITDWKVAAEALARLQMDSIGKTDSIMVVCKHDVRIPSLRDLIGPFLDVIARLMKEQTKTPPPILSQPELTLLSTRLDESLTSLHELELPDALGHLDLNPGNIIVRADKSVFLDWAEAYIGHPLLSFEYLLEHFRRTSTHSFYLESQLINSYCTPWKERISATVITQARRFTPLVAAFAYAVGLGTWQDPKRLEDPQVRGYLRSLSRRMNREAERPFDQRALCLI